MTQFDRDKQYKLSEAGKSTMVDQLARKIIRVTMCLFPSSNEGSAFCSFFLEIEIIEGESGG